MTNGNNPITGGLMPLLGAGVTVVAGLGLVKLTQEMMEGTKKKAEKKVAVKQKKYLQGYSNLQSRSSNVVNKILGK
jgi:hypothetical protein